MLSIGAIRAFYMDATLVAVGQGDNTKYGATTELTFDLRIPGTDLDGGRLTLVCFTNGVASNKFKIGGDDATRANLTIDLGEPKPTLLPTGKLHVGYGPDKALCRVFPDATEFYTVGLNKCPHCALDLVR